MHSSFSNSCKFFDYYDPEVPTQANIVVEENQQTRRTTQVQMDIETDFGY